MRMIFLLCLLVPSLAYAQAGAKPLRLGYLPNITHAQALYAKATGEFEKALGVPIEWVPFNAGPSAIESLFIDAVDATYVGPSPTINGYIKSKGEKFVIVAGSASGGAGLVVRQDSGIAGGKGFQRQGHRHAAAGKHAGPRRARVVCGARGIGSRNREERSSWCPCPTRTS